ncbi:MAG TPA: 3-isopropylmalate dehydrogenase [Candidatus Saccharimonadia bacterium]|jgi:3-isopropylmalate dehydrogenase|nr:3-isopropylmalate dehydrogenase [Candidatus Saccharimonadia bacterium]
MKKHIAVLPGDGIGPEVTAGARAVLERVAKTFGHDFSFTEGQIGACAIDATGEPFPPDTQKLCASSDAILFGAIGDPKYDNDPTAKVRPEQGLLAMRKTLGLYANVRPVITFAALAGQSPLRADLVQDVDFVVIRELIGGIYFGKRGRSSDGTSAFDTAEYSRGEIERVATYAFELARTRRHKLTVVDKANVLETSRLWRETVQAMEARHPDVTVDYMFVDNAAMKIIQNPAGFDVVVTENMFGDILTDEASVITGSLGMLPSASVGGKVALYEPIHGSYPQAAGKNIANPIGSILSAAMLLEGFGLHAEGACVRRAVEDTLDAGFGTEDLRPVHLMSTTKLSQEIINAIRK